MTASTLPLRMVATLPIAAAVTLGLVYCMYQLVQGEERVVLSDPPVKISPVILEPEEIETRPEPLNRPDPLEAPPPVPRQFNPPAVETTSLTYAVALPEPEPGVDGERFFSADGQLVSLTKVRPLYPSRGVGVEGYVDVAFDVTATGATTNVHVIASEPQGFFDREVIRAVKRWKYRPRVVDGRAQPTYNLVERVRFELEQ